jgi:hypothetical protein
MLVCRVSSVKASLANDELGGEPIHPVPVLLSSSEDHVLIGDITGTIVQFVRFVRVDESSIEFGPVVLYTEAKYTILDDPWS